MKIVALILRHELTIVIACASRKSRDGSIAKNRNRAHEIKIKCGDLKMKSASAIAWCVEIVRKVRTAPAGLAQTSFERQSSRF
jgi:hypothetical protein